jgi:hypothetical protein
MAEPSPGSEPGGAPAAGEDLEESGPPDLDEIRSWSGYRLDDLTGAGVGRVEGPYMAESGGRPEWMLARMGRFGHHCLVPVRDAVAAGRHVWVPYKRELIREAPRIEPGTRLTPEGEAELRSHYEVRG